MLHVLSCIHVLYIATVHFTTIVTETHFLLNLVIVHNHYPSACRTSSTFPLCYSPLARWGQIECQNLCQIECQKKCQIECQKDRMPEILSEYMSDRMPKKMSKQHVRLGITPSKVIFNWSLKASRSVRRLQLAHQQCWQGFALCITLVAWHPKALCKGRNGRCASSVGHFFDSRWWKPYAGRCREPIITSHIKLVKSIQQVLLTSSMTASSRGLGRL